MSIMPFRATLLNRRASDAKDKSDQIIETLMLRSGQNIADIGSGGGYFTLRFADAVGKNGMVYAIDTDSKFLEFISETASKKGVNNIKTVLVGEGELNLPLKSLDVIFLRNVYHHLHDRVEYFKNIQKFLKSEGKIAIIDYRHASLFSFIRIFGHLISKEEIVKEMENAGYYLKDDFDFLPKQSFSIFLKR